MHADHLLRPWLRRTHPHREDDLSGFSATAAELESFGPGLRRRAGDDPLDLGPAPSERTSPDLMQRGDRT